MEREKKVSKAEPLQIVQRNNPVQYVVVGLLIVAAFLLGSLYTKVQYLEKNGNSGGTAVNNPKSKYASFDDAMKQLSKDVKIDGNKLVTCMNSGSKKDKITKQASYGSTVGVSGTPAFFINGRFVGGAFPAESFKEIIDKELAGTGSNNVTDYSDYLQKAAQQGAFNPESKTIDLTSAQIKGPNDAKIVFVEFSDFQCPYCSQAYQTLTGVLKEYEGKIKFAYLHFPLSQIHPRAEITAQASECAADQGKFWEFHDRLFQTQSDWSTL